VAANDSERRRQSSLSSSTYNTFTEVLAGFTGSFFGGIQI
jgi:hypothetical protein